MPRREREKRRKGENKNVKGIGRKWMARQKEKRDKKANDEKWT